MNGNRFFQARILSVVFLVFASASSALFAQAVSGDLVGVVADASGGGIPNATVTAQNDATGVKTTVTTEGSGAYRFQNLPVGAYTVTGTANNFSPDTVKGVQIQLNATLTQNLTLNVGAATTTTVEFTEAAAAVDT